MLPSHRGYHTPEKTGSKIEGSKKLYDPYPRKIIPAYRALVIVLWANGLRIPLYVELFREEFEKAIRNMQAEQELSEFLIN